MPSCCEALRDAIRFGLLREVPGEAGAEIWLTHPDDFVIMGVAFCPFCGSRVRRPVEDTAPL